MRTVRKIAALLLVVIVMISCDAAKGISGAYNMINCRYTYNSIDNISIAGINLSGGADNISLPNILKLTSILSGNATSIPVGMTVNLDVRNPNPTAAFLDGLQYIIVVDDLQLTSGSISQPLNLASGETKVFSIRLNVDVADYLKGDSKDTVTNALKNIAGIGDKQSKITVQIKPTFLVGSTPVTSPVYIPVNFTLGD